MLNYSPDGLLLPNGEIRETNEIPFESRTDRGIENGFVFCTFSYSSVMKLNDEKEKTFANLIKSETIKKTSIGSRPLGGKYAERDLIWGFTKIVSEMGCLLIVSKRDQAKLTEVSY